VFNCQSVSIKMVTVLLSVSGSAYSVLPPEPGGTCPSRLDGADLVVLAKKVEKFKVALAKPEDPLCFNILFMGVSEEESRRTPVTGLRTLASLAERHAGAAPAVTIYVLVEPKTAVSTSPPWETSSSATPARGEFHGDSCVHGGELASLVMAGWDSESCLRVAAKRDLTNDELTIFTPLGTLHHGTVLHRLGKNFDLVKDGFEDDSFPRLEAASGSAPAKATASPPISGSPVQSSGRATPVAPPAGVSAFACVGKHGSAVNARGHAVARDSNQESCCEPCFVGRVGTASEGLTFVADKIMAHDGIGHVLVVHVSVRPARRMSKEEFLGCLQRFFATECSKEPFAVLATAAGTGPGEDIHILKPLAVLPSAAGDPKDGSPLTTSSSVAIPPSADDCGELLHQEKFSAFAERRSPHRPPPGRLPALVKSLAFCDAADSGPPEAVNESPSCLRVQYTTLKD
jgi:hypothetical protein